MTSESPLAANPDPAQVRRGRRILVLIFALFFGSLLLAGLLRFSGWQPPGSKVHGDMLQPAVDARALVPKLADGSDYLWKPTERTWRIVVAPPEDCVEACVKLAQDLDKVWQLFGGKADHVHILWIGTPPADAPTNAAMRVVQPSAELRAALPHLDEVPGVPIYVIDPNGFVILRYPPGTDPGFVRTDVARLLKLP